MQAWAPEYWIDSVQCIEVYFAPGFSFHKPDTADGWRKLKKKRGGRDKPTH